MTCSIRCPINLRSEHPIAIIDVKELISVDHEDMTS
jgi:hypothetical protein